MLSLRFFIIHAVFVQQIYVEINGDPFHRKRVHYLAAVEKEYNYLPETTPLSEEQRENAKKYVEKNEHSRIGSIYTKAVYREYTDDTYTTLKPRERWLGILGPLLKAEVEDVFEIHLLNNISHPVSLHTHGAQYEKRHEGAVYHNQSSGNESAKILPGEKYVYQWTIPPERGPTESDNNCMIWAYHSHIQGDTDIHTGLLGPLIICKPGFLLSNDSDFFKSYVLFFMIFDENQSWYLDQNIKQKIGNLTDDDIEALKEDESFTESNQMYSVNGLMYDNLLDLDACLGSFITWHFFGFGNEADIHSVTLTGQPILLHGHRTDVVHLLPGKFVSAIMKTSQEGRWVIKSEVGDHSHAGMQVHFQVRKCDNNSNGMGPPVARRTRQYFITAEEDMWDYGPTGTNLLTNISLTDDSEASEFFQRKPDRIGGIYKKVLYKEYTDQSFSIPKARKLHMGILGPMLKVEVGELLEVTFLNRASRPYNFYSTAFVCQNCSSNTVNEAVLPGQSKTYRFFISESLGPSKTDPVCISWRYFSNVNFLKDSYSGLNGILLTCRPQSLSDDGSQNFVDKEYAIMFAVIDENESHYIEDNMALMVNGSANIDPEDPDFVESNLMHSINGLMYGNLQGIHMCLDGNISWHFISIGHEVDLHVASFQGNAFKNLGNYKDTVELLPGSHTTVTMKPDVTGKWLLQCQTNDHIKGGMQTFYNVRSCNKDAYDPITQQGGIREYFIAAVEEEWDYAPEALHPITGENLTDNEDSKIFVTNDDTHIGSRYKKVLYREHTDASFKHRKTHSNHLGFLGPVIKGEVGDIIKITFFNNASRAYNIKPHGLIDLSNETRWSHPVEPGDTKMYTWLIPLRAGPSETGFNCTNWIYYSAVDVVKDTNSGLVGSLVVCNPGVLRVSGSRNDVDEEFSILFTVLDENESWYLEENIETYCKDSAAVDTGDENFKESNLKHSINGLIYGSLKGLVGHVGDKVAWYLMGLGTEIDIHSVHFHGLVAVENADTSLSKGHREDVVELLPGVFKTVEMTLDVAGSWMFHCHVDDHLKAGMMTMVTVNP